MGATYRGAQQPRKQAGFDTSAEADGRRAYKVGLAKSACPHRGYAHGPMAAWLRGWMLEAANDATSGRAN